MQRTLLATLIPLMFSSPALSAEGPISVEFTNTPPPSTEHEMAQAYTRSSALVTYPDGRKKLFPLAYQTLFRSGDKIGSAEAGLVVDRNGNPVMRTVADEQGRYAAGPFHAYAPDGTSLIRHRAGNVERLFLVTQYEYHTEAPLASGAGSMELYAQLPASMSLAQLSQNKKTGVLKADTLRNIDMSSVGGLWIPCAASRTPWNTHLGGEEYEPNARQFADEPLEAMNLFLGTPGKRVAEGGANPYRYGHLIEVAVDAGGATRVHKRLAMGRLAAELADVMPDQRTAYMGDDGRDTVMFMFVADAPADLSAGTLYAAKWEQTSAEEGGSAKLTWIRLGHAHEREIEALLTQGVGYGDIFTEASATEVKANPEQYKDYGPVYVYEGQAGKRVPGSGGKQEVTYLKVRDGMETAAAFLETRRYAAMMGATSEFTKMEGVTHNADDRRLYLAMSYIEGGMVDGQNEERPQDDIKLKGDPKDLACGGVYQAYLIGGQEDSEGRAIGSDWVAANLKPLLLGAKKPFGQRHGKYDTCDTDRIANPDNIKYAPELRTLFIGEDSGNHLNNFLWAYNLDSGNPVRILSAPAGGEHTGLQYVADLNGFGYVMGNIQHPGAASDLKKHPDEIKAGLRSRIDPRGIVGYLSGLPAFER